MHAHNLPGELPGGSLPNDQGEPKQQHARYFTPWQAWDETRTCWTCAHSIGYDGVHLWCQRAQLVVVIPCGSWERRAGCDVPA